MSERTLPVRVWDAPIRLFHWAIVLLLGAAWLTESVNWMELHFLCGYSLLALLLFRIAWGFVGSDTARFSRFVKSPLAVLHHLAYLCRSEPDTEAGHNPAGGWMVLLLLVLIAVQVSTGLCANDQGDTEGPLFPYVGQHWSDWLTHIHSLNFTLIQIAVVVHVVAVAGYIVLKRQDLIRPMITGWKYLPRGVAAPAFASPWRAIIVFAIAAGAVAVLVNVL